MYSFSILLTGTHKESLMKSIVDALKNCSVGFWYDDLKEFLSSLDDEKYNKLYEESLEYTIDFDELLGKMEYEIYDGYMLHITTEYKEILSKIIIEKDAERGDLYSPKDIHSYFTKDYGKEKIDQNILIAHLYLEGLINLKLGSKDMNEFKSELLKNVTRLLTRKVPNHKMSQIFRGILFTVIEAEYVTCSLTDSAFDIAFAFSIKSQLSKINELDIDLEKKVEKLKDIDERQERFSAELITIMSLIITAFSIIGFNVYALGVSPNMPTIVIINLSLALVLSFVFLLLDIIVFSKNTKLMLIVVLITATIFGGAMYFFDSKGYINPIIYNTSNTETSTETSISTETK